jgi:hypothetical protein
VHAAAHRRAYHDVYARWVRVCHPRLRHELDTLGASLRAGRAIGVHKRVDTPGTAAYQGEHRRVASHADFIAATRTLMHRTDAPTTHVYLATDDATAVAAFRAAFGALLVVRADVRRTEGGITPDAQLNEVHIKSSHTPPATLQDAADGALPPAAVVASTRRPAALLRAHTAACRTRASCVDSTPRRHAARKLRDGAAHGLERHDDRRVHGTSGRDGPHR